MISLHNASLIFLVYVLKYNVWTSKDLTLLIKGILPWNAIPILHPLLQITYEVHFTVINMTKDVDHLQVVSLSDKLKTALDNRGEWKSFSTENTCIPSILFPKFLLLPIIGLHE